MARTILSRPIEIAEPLRPVADNGEERPARGEQEDDDG